MKNSSAKVVISPMKRMLLPTSLLMIMENLSQTLKPMMKTVDGARIASLIKLQQPINSEEIWILMKEPRRKM